MGLERVPFYLREAVCEEMSHGIEVSNLAVLIAKELGESEEFCNRIELAGILHDIGKLKLTKYLYAEDGLLVEQMKYVRQHSAQSYAVVKEAGYSEEIVEAVYHHHENYNGSGYPDNLRGEEIPWMARILRVCDVFVALTSDRSYRNAFEPKAALEIMIDEVADYDMKVFLAFQRVVHSGALGQEMCRIKTVKSWKQIEPLQLFEEEIKWLV
ncbi:MAG TPA: phosphohydrolase [Lachnospiraceae bacterium]|nr:phosphohydrolase [Lachnospiraceae bacterium]